MIPSFVQTRNVQYLMIYLMMSYYTWQTPEGKFQCILFSRIKATFLVLCYMHSSEFKWAAVNKMIQLQMQIMLPMWDHGCNIIGIIKCQKRFRGHDDVIKWKYFRVTGPLRGESTGHRWNPLTKASDAEPWRFLWSAHEHTFEQRIETPSPSL